MTVSVVPEKWCQAFSPWSDAEPLRCSTPMLKGADRLRKSLVPSLLEARRINESVGNDVRRTVRNGHIYLPQATRAATKNPGRWVSLRDEDSHFLKGVVESCLEMLHITEPLAVRHSRVALLDAAQQCCLELDGRVLGYLGEVDPRGLQAVWLARSDDGSGTGSRCPGRRRRTWFPNNSC